MIYIYIYIYIATIIYDIVQYDEYNSSDSNSSV